MIVEVLIKDRVANFNPGQIAELDDESPLFRALINGGKADVINPPDWPHTAKPEVVPVPEVKPEVKVEDDGESDHQQESDGEGSGEAPVNSRRSRKKSRKSPESDAGDSPEGYRGFDQFVASPEDVRGDQDDL